MRRNISVSSVQLFLNKEESFVTIADQHNRLSEVHLGTSYLKVIHWVGIQGNLPLMLSEVSQCIQFLP